MCPNPPRVAFVPGSFTPVQCARTPPVCQETPRSSWRPGVAEPGLRTIGARRENSHTGNMCANRSLSFGGRMSSGVIRCRPVSSGADVPARRVAGSCRTAMTAGRGCRRARPRKSAVPAVGDDDAVPAKVHELADGPARGTVRCLVARDGPVPPVDDAPGNVAVVARLDRVPAFRREKDRNASCASADPRCPGTRTAPTGPDVRVTTYRLGVNCEASPQISAPALVRTHQRQLTGTCKIFGMPRNRNTEAPRLVVIT